jgi:hypothetical protein
LEAASEFLAAADARSSGDLSAASAHSASAAEKFVVTSGIDDDFPVFWVRAISDAVNANDLPTANRLLKLVDDAPWGHVPPLQRGLLPWLRAIVNVQAGHDAGVDDDFAAAALALRSVRAPFYLGRALLDHASWLRDHDRADEAEPLVSEAVELFTRLGAEPWIERAKQLHGVAVD